MLPLFLVEWKAHPYRKYMRREPAKRYRGYDTDYIF